MYHTKRKKVVGLSKLKARRARRGISRYHSFSPELTSALKSAWLLIWYSLAKQYLDIKFLFRRRVRRAYFLKSKQISKKIAKANEAVRCSRENSKNLESSKYGNFDYLLAVFARIENRKQYLLDRYELFDRLRTQKEISRRRKEFEKSKDIEYELGSMEIGDVDSSLPLKEKFEREFKEHLERNPIPDSTFEDFEALIDARIRKMRVNAYRRYIQKIDIVNRAKEVAFRAEFSLSNLDTDKSKIYWRWLYLPFATFYRWIMSRQSLNFLSFGYGSIASISLLSIFSIDLPNISAWWPRNEQAVLIPIYSPIDPNRLEFEVLNRDLQLLSLKANRQLPIHWQQDSVSDVTVGYSGNVIKLIDLPLRSTTCNANTILIVGTASQSGADAVNEKVSKERAQSVSDKIRIECPENPEQLHLLLALRSPQFDFDDGIQRQLFLKQIETATPIGQYSQQLLVNTILSKLGLNYSAVEFKFDDNSSGNSVYSQWFSLR